MRIELCVAGLFSLVAGSAIAIELPRVFFTSVQGNGDLSTWPDAHGATGLAAADEICRSRAAAASITNADQYVALLSDSHDDAYCRWHGAVGKRADNCGETTLPTGAGPLYRMDDLPAFDISQNSMPPIDEVGYIPRPIVFDEFGNAIPDSQQDGQSSAFVASTTEGSYAGASCADWTSASDPNDVGLGSAYLGFGNLLGSLWTCDHTLRLICAQKGRDGAALARPRPPNARLAFFSEATGSADLSSWPDADGAAGLEAGDAICRAAASHASLPLPATFKAWLSTSTTNAPDRFVFDGPIYRIDGVRVADSVAQLSSGLLDAPIQLDEFAAFGPNTFEDVWTGTAADGTAALFTCADWTSAATDAGAEFGQTYAADVGWTEFYVPGIFPTCSTAEHLYCIGDNDSLFMYGFD